MTGHLFGPVNGDAIAASAGYRLRLALIDARTGDLLGADAPVPFEWKTAASSMRAGTATIDQQAAFYLAGFDLPISRRERRARRVQNVVRFLVPWLIALACVFAFIGLGIFVTNVLFPGGN